jgi:hypothetical protein
VAAAPGEKPAFDRDERGRKANEMRCGQKGDCRCCPTGAPAAGKTDMHRVFKEIVLPLWPKQLTFKELPKELYPFKIVIEMAS